LRARIDLPDFIKEESAASGLFETADAPFMRAGERPPFVPEQFALEKLRRKCGTMYNHKFRFVPPTQIVNRMRG
jgi:hypothetical protein